MEPPDYDPELIHRLRPPEIEEAPDGWVSVWEIECISQQSSLDVDRISHELELVDHVRRVSVQAKGDSLNLKMTTDQHPLDVEAYPMIDAVLMTVDRAVGGVRRINGSPRDEWRTFRRSWPPAESP